MPSAQWMWKYSKETTADEAVKGWRKGWDKGIERMEVAKKELTGSPYQVGNECKSIEKCAHESVMDMF